MGVLPSPALHYLWVGESYATVSPAGRILRADGSRAGLRAAPRTKRAPDGQMATQGAHSRGNLAAPSFVAWPGDRHSWRSDGAIYMSVRPHPGEETGSYRGAVSNGKNSTRATGGQGMGTSDTGGSAWRPRRLMRRTLIVLGSLDRKSTRLNS